MQRSRRGGLAAALLLLALGVGLTMAEWPLWREPDGIEQWIERRVPIGTDAGTVRQFIRERGWKPDGEWQQQSSSIDYGTEKGTYVIHAGLGGYWLIFRTDFDAFFGFDARGRLVDVHVRKMVDAL
jgi:hypothetical protein